MDPVETIKVGNFLGEGVLWDDRTQSLWWTDIDARRLYCLQWQGRILHRYETPERLCSFGFLDAGAGLIAAFESGFALYDPRSGACQWLWKLERPGQRLNDGRVDPQGRFWCGGMAECDEAAGQAELYCLHGDGRVECRAQGFTISNDIAWSPDGATFYFADSIALTIWRHDFCGRDGSIGAPQVFARTPVDILPDGAAVDADGHLWSALWGGGCVVRYAPDGAIERTLAVPVRQPTCVAFGGPELDLLFVTSARKGVSAAGAGDLFVYNVGVVGLPEHRFRCGGHS